MASLGICLALGALVVSASAGNHLAFVPAALETTRAYQYATMSEALCLAELAERKVPFELVRPAALAGGVSNRHPKAIARGVATPIRLTGPVRGVRYVQTHRTEPDPRAPATILDCPLALAIDDLSRVLAKRGVVEVEYLCMYRPGRMRPGTRHPAGRAIDVAIAKLADGSSHSVKRDFHGRVGAQTCGRGAEPAWRDEPGARFWRAVVCEVDALRSFNLMLTPNYDAGHRDHLHLEVRSGVRWFLTQ
ncbi:MAG: extensin family protein [Deltaproteobacteria bacterium]|nr:extensin family protein [Deltaproteobacteria bacterium]